MENKIKIRYEEDAKSGTHSWISWENEIWQKFLPQIFGEKPHEQLTDVYIDRSGMTAKFEFKYDKSK